MAKAFVRLAVVAGSVLAGTALGAEAAWPPLAGGVVGAVVGAGAVGLEIAAARAPVEPLFWSAAGGAGGLLVGLAVGLALAPLVPAGWSMTPALGALLGAYCGAAVALARHRELAGVSALIFGRAATGTEKIVDTSTLIDGRIADVAEAGFVEGPLAVPRFVLQELQRVADAPDPTRRARGRRGFEVLERLQRDPGASVEIVETDVPGIAEVDAKLVALARARRARLLTGDASLARLAEVSGVRALNVNTLAAGLRPAVLPGQALSGQVLREGKEPGQGVAFLDDGTMVVVEQGKRLIGQAVEVVVTSVLQTSAGRMIFTRVRGEDAGRDG